jgi:predicted AlkP superfamily phosphohydrolase/phosphomutase
VEQAETYPAELGREIKNSIESSRDENSSQLKRFFNLPKQKMEAFQNKKPTDVEDILDIFKVALEIDQGFIIAAIYAIEKYMPDAAFLYLNGVDASEHHFWRFIEPNKFKGVSNAEIKQFGNVINEYYIYMDEVLGRLLALYEGRAGELTVIVISDHGHEANEGYDPKSEVHYNRVCSGGHEEAPDGIIIVSGKDIAAKAELMGASVFDIAPTVLAIMGVPVGQDMPGRVLTEIIRPEFFASHPVTSVPSYSTGRGHSEIPVRSPMSEALKEKLKGLGYID